MKYFVVSCDRKDELYERKKFFTCRNDVAFKEMFLKETNKDILKALLESILKVQIHKIEYNNVELINGNIYSRGKRVDLLLTTNIGKLQIEVNNGWGEYTSIRNMAYISNIYSTTVLKGEEYLGENIIQINFTYGLKDEKKIREYKVMDKDQKQFVNNFEIIEINMDKYKKNWYNSDELDKEKYIVMLDLQNEELKKLKDKSKDRLVSKYMEELNNIQEDMSIYHYMTEEEDIRKKMNSERYYGKKEGLEQGLEQGSIQEKYEIAKKMLKEKLDINLIMNITDLSKEEIEKLR